MNTILICRFITARLIGIRFRLACCLVITAFFGVVRLVGILVIVRSGTSDLGTAIWVRLALIMALVVREKLPCLGLRLAISEAVSSSSFTLIKLLVGTTIIGILAYLLLPARDARSRLPSGLTALTTFGKLTWLCTSMTTKIFCLRRYHIILQIVGDRCVMIHFFVYHAVGWHRLSSSQKDAGVSPA